jgi:hypothetical protein
MAFWLRRLGCDGMTIRCLTWRKGAWDSLRRRLGSRSWKRGQVRNGTYSCYATRTYIQRSLWSGRQVQATSYTPRQDKELNI